MRGWWWNFVSQPWVTCKWNRHWAGIPGEEHQEFAMWGTIYEWASVGMDSPTWGSMYRRYIESISKNAMWGRYYERDTSMYATDSTAWGTIYEQDTSMYVIDSTVWGTSYDWIAKLSSSKSVSWGSEYETVEITEPRHYPRWGSNYGITNL